MKKVFNIKIGQSIQEMISKKINKKEDIFLLLLYTIRQINSEKYIDNKECVFAKVLVLKMNRIFYVLDNKIFSLQFPFSIIENDNSSVMIYDYITKIEIDSKVLSVLIGFFERMKDFVDTFDDFFEIYYDVLSDIDKDLQNDIWKIILNLYRLDIGYIRYDYDDEHQNGDIHPLNHFDIFFDDMAKVKIGLKHRIDESFFTDTLDVTTKCIYIEH